jgi:hypothetical protein
MLRRQGGAIRLNLSLVSLKVPGNNISARPRGVAASLLLLRTFCARCPGVLDSRADVGPQISVRYVVQRIERDVTHLFARPLQYTMRVRQFAAPIEAKVHVTE